MRIQFLLVSMSLCPSLCLRRLRCLDLSPCGRTGHSVQSDVKIKVIPARTNTVMRVKLSALAIVLICGAFYACSSPKSAFSVSSVSEDGKSAVIAEVNGEAAHKAALDRFVKSRLSDFTNQNEQGQDENDKQRSQLLDEFIQRQLIIQEAHKNNIEPTDDEIRRALEEQHKQANAQGADQNQKNVV